MATSTALAWVLDGPEKLSLERINLPPLQPGWVRCRVLRFQPSITDLMRFRGLGDAADYQRGHRFMGHEFVARVVEVHPLVQPSLIGCRVVCPPRNPCVSCRPWLRGQPYLGEQPIQIGVNGPGA